MTPEGTFTTLHTAEVHAERKKFTLSLRENHQGKFLRITEEVGGHRDAIVVPAGGIKPFAAALASIAALL